MKITTEIFVKRAKEKHGKKYEYKNVIYERNNLKVKILCKLHGEFSQTPNKHLCGQGCPICGRSFVGKKLTYNTKTFIEKAKKVHGDRYDYSNTIYKKSYVPVKIRCKKHGEFNQKPTGHLVGRGCYKCGRESMAKKQSSDKEYQLARARVAHGNRYDYSLVKYVKCDSKVKIVCGRHGVFKQTLSIHNMGHGCPRCKGENSGGRWNTSMLSKEEMTLPACVYYLKMFKAGEVFYKIGFTGNLSERIEILDRYSGYKINVLYVFKGTKLSSLSFEKKLHEYHEAFKYLPKCKFPGYTECYSKDVLGLDV